MWRFGKSIVVCNLRTVSTDVQILYSSTSVSDILQKKTSKLFEFINRLISSKLLHHMIWDLATIDIGNWSTGLHLYLIAIHFSYDYFFIRNNLGNGFLFYWNSFISLSLFEIISLSTDNRSPVTKQPHPIIHWESVCVKRSPSFVRPGRRFRISDFNGRRSFCV